MASLRERDTIVLQQQVNLSPEKTMDTDDQVCYDDPQFTKILKTILQMEIAACKEKLIVNIEKIKKIKINIRNELHKRKELKKNLAHIIKINANMSESLAKLRVIVSEANDKLEAMKANVDDEYKLMEQTRQEYRDIITEYKNTSAAYHAKYEEFPLAKARKMVRIKQEKLQISLMVLNYKKTEAMKIIRQQQRIDWIRMRCKIVEFAGVMSKRLKLEERLTKLKVNINYYNKELRSVEMEMQIQRKKMEDEKRQRTQKMLEMAQSRMNIPYRKMYTQNQAQSSPKNQWRQIAETFDDTVSINSVLLEELYIDDATISTEKIDLVQNKQPESTVVQTEVSNPKDPVVPEKMDTQVVSVVPDVEMNVAEEATSADNDVEMKVIDREETRRSHESTKTQTSFRTKGNLKHTVDKSAQDELEAKRMRLQRENSKESSSNRINVHQPSTVNHNHENNVDLPKSSSSLPKIQKIETVNYDPVMLQKFVHPSSIASSNISSSRNAYCESNIGSFDFSKDLGSLCGDPGSSCGGSVFNYQLSPSYSSACFEAETPTSSPAKPLQQDDHKNQPNNNIPLFQNVPQFNNPKKGNFLF